MLFVASNTSHSGMLILSINKPITSLKINGMDVKNVDNLKILVNHGFCSQLEMVKSVSTGLTLVRGGGLRRPDQQV